MVDEDGNASGYYYDLMNLLQDINEFNYEFISVTLKDGIDKLLKDEIDIMLGVPLNTKHKEQLIFNRYSTNEEKFGVFSNYPIEFNELEFINDLQMGMVEEDYNAELVVNLLKANNIQANIVYEKDYKTLEQRMQSESYDLYIRNKYKEKDYYLVYEFIGRDLYIAGNKKSQYILDYIDEAIEQCYKDRVNSIELLKRQYFGESMVTQNKGRYLFLGSLFFIITSITYSFIHTKVMKYKIKMRLIRNVYTLYYQPIYNPRTNTIVGFEGLLRYFDKNKKILPPNKILPEIEKYSMLFEVTLWILEKAIKDYSNIKNYNCMKNKEFYISINISMKEIQNDIFIDKAIDILLTSNLGPEKICLEIIERFKLENADLITKNLCKLKQAGYKIAIDDFGTEYSNFDVFQKLNADVIKVDKTFVDGIGKDELKHEVVLFISRLADIRNQSVILEGVEDVNQVHKIKQMNKMDLFVQGYYYSKPVHMEAIKQF